METPEFLLWALEYACLIRGQQDGTDPEKTERQLRAARAVSDARQEGREHEGIAVDPPNGSRVAEALAIYGGEREVARACSTCPANAPSSPAGQWAGCFGFVVLPSPCNAIRRHCLESPLARRSLESLASVAADQARGEETLKPAWDDFGAAIQVARERDLPMHVRLYPPGRVEGTWWKLAPHCPRCKAEWPTGSSPSAAEGVPCIALRCSVCGYVGHPAPDKKRRARGMRPYYPLDRLLGGEQAMAFMGRYESRGERGASGNGEPRVSANGERGAPLTETRAP
jgi:hypothetical protein